MNIYTTELTAICVKTGEVETFCGEHVFALTEFLAQEWCDENKGYLKVTGRLVATIPLREEEDRTTTHYVDVSLN